MKQIGTGVGIPCNLSQVKSSQVSARVYCGAAEAEGQGQGQGWLNWVASRYRYSGAQGFSLTYRTSVVATFG